MRTAIYPLLVALLLPATARAGEDLAPTGEATAHTLTASGEPDPTSWYLLDGGTPLEYPLRGPAELNVQVRRVFPEEPGASPEPVGLLALGDGHEILEITSYAGPDETVHCEPAPGGSIGGPDRALVTVPEGEHLFSLDAAPPLRFLVRVITQDRSAEEVSVAPTVPAVSAGTPAPQASPHHAAPPPAEDVVEVGTEGSPDDDMDRFIDEIEVFDSEEEFDFDEGTAGTSPPEASSPSPSPDTAAGAEPQAGSGLKPGESVTTVSTPAGDSHTERSGSPPSDAPGIDSTEPTPGTSHVGARLGLGAPARATRATLYLGVEGRYPLPWKNTVLQGSLGYYRIGVHTEEVARSPHAGSSVIEVDYHTGVVPLEANLLVPFSNRIAGWRPHVGAGLGLYFSSRKEEGERTGGASLGTQWFLGADRELERGSLSTSLLWNGARKQYGNVDAAGDPVRETLASLRLHVAWLYPF